MNENLRHLPAPQPSAELTSLSSANNPVLRRMSEGLLQQARQTQLQRTRYRIGSHELREPDYRLICLWANELGMVPEALLQVLAQSRFDPPSGGFHAPIAFGLEDGALRSLVWDFDRLPRFPDLWVDGLCLQTLGFTLEPKKPVTLLVPKCLNLRRLYIGPSEGRYNSVQPSCNLDLSGVPNLVELECVGIGLTELDLTPVPQLTKLDCSYNDLAVLDLTHVPRLTVLDCSFNGLAELDLTHVPGLTVLDCCFNQLFELDLAPVLGLRGLNCDGNQLDEFDLSPVPGLTSLSCADNQLVLDLSPVPRLITLDFSGNVLIEGCLYPMPGLTALRCSGCELTELDLAPVPELTELDCSCNDLNEIDLALVPGLTWLHCKGNQLTVLDLSPAPGLTHLWCDDNVVINNAPPDLRIHQ